ncbi:MAG: FAD-dependent oxidoreductase [Pseudomonadota bacterium]
MLWSANPTDAISLWNVTAPAGDDYSRLSDDVETEVAIIGGGFCGCSIALHLAERGVDCRLLEAEFIGYGGSGRNAGLLNAGLWLPPQDIRAALGEVYGERLVTLLSDAPAYVGSLVDRFGIECELTRSGTIHAAHAPSGMKELRRRAQAWQSLGAPVELINAQRVSALVGSEIFHGGILDHRAGTINPMGYVRGLARAATQAGAVLHTKSPVKKLNRVERIWRIETPRGTVRAPKVVLCTNAYSDQLWPGLARVITPVHYYQVASEPLGERADAILADRQGVWDTGKIMYSLRKDAANRLILGSMGKLLGPDAAVTRRWADRQLRRTFPDLGPVKWEVAWHGTMGLTGDHLPKIRGQRVDLRQVITG